MQSRALPQSLDLLGFEWASSETILAQHEAKRIHFARTYVACMGLPHEPETAGLKLPLFDAMPRPCAVVSYVGFYPPAFLLTDATALCRGTSRSFLEAMLATNVSDHGTRPWHQRREMILRCVETSVKHHGTRPWHQKYCADVLKKGQLQNAPAKAGASGWRAAHFCPTRPSLVCPALWG